MGPLFRTRKDGANMMWQSVQLPSVSCVDSKLGLTMASLQSEPKLLAPDLLPVSKHVCQICGN